MGLIPAPGLLYIPVTTGFEEDVVGKKENEKHEEKGGERGVKKSRMKRQRMRIRRMRNEEAGREKEEENV